MYIYPTMNLGGGGGGGGKEEENTWCGGLWWLSIFEMSTSTPENVPTSSNSWGGGGGRFQRNERRETCFYWYRCGSVLVFPCLRNCRGTRTEVNIWRRHILKNFYTVKLSLFK